MDIRNTYIKNILEKNNIKYTCDYSLFNLFTFVIKYKEEELRICSGYDTYNFKGYDYVRLSGFCLDSASPFHLFELEDVLKAQIYGSYKVGNIDKSGYFLYTFISNEGKDPLDYKTYFEEKYKAKVLSISSFDGSIDLKFAEV